MAHIISNVLSAADLEYLNSLPEVVQARQRLSTEAVNSAVYFSIQVTDEIKAALLGRIGLDLSNISEVPMRWIKGDTAPHIDVGRSAFETTYLVYLNDCPGSIVINREPYPITQNTAYVFNEGLHHETIGTNGAPRLLIGPMSEAGLPVGSPIIYFSNEADALADINSLGSSGTYTVGDGGPFGGYTSWRIASNSSGSSSQLVVYPNGSVLNNDGTYYLYPAIPCFLEGSSILCSIDGVEQYIYIEDIRNGTLVKTSRDGYKKVVVIGKGYIVNPGHSVRTENRLYKCSTSKYPELKDDLIITGDHSILVDKLTDAQHKKTINALGKIFITDNKYRLMACADERAEPWNSEGRYPIWHFALENADERMNYGVYANGGLLVESCSIRFLKNKSNMMLL